MSNIICAQPFACLPNHVIGKGMFRALRNKYPNANIVAIDYDPGASEVNQLNRIKLMIATAFQMREDEADEHLNLTGDVDLSQNDPSEYDPDDPATLNACTPEFASMGGPVPLGMPKIRVR